MTMKTTQTVLTKDKIVRVETIVTESDRVVDYDDILESVSVEYDEWFHDAPWEHCDGLEHDYNRIGWYAVDDVRGSRGYGYSDANRESFVITIDDDQVKEWGNYDYHRARGCSKQVARELTAQEKRNTLDRLVRWYSNGWEWYSVQGEYKDYIAGVGGVDCPEYAETLRWEIADEIAAEMESDGYIIEDRHNPHEQTHQQQLQNRLNWNRIKCAPRKTIPFDLSQWQGKLAS